MFNRIKNLKELDVSDFNTKFTTNMYAMFAWLDNLESINVSSLNTSNVVNM